MVEANFLHTYCQSSPLEAITHIMSEDIFPDIDLSKAPMDSSEVDERLKALSLLDTVGWNETRLVGFMIVLVANNRKSLSCWKQHRQHWRPWRVVKRAQETLKQRKKNSLKEVKLTIHCWKIYL